MAEQSKKVAELFEIAERERKELLAQIRVLKEVVRGVRELGNSVFQNVRRQLDSYKAQLGVAAETTVLRRKKPPKSQQFGLNGFEITYSLGGQAFLEQELQLLNSKNASLGAELLSLKNVNSLLLEKLKTAEEKERKGVERLSSTFAVGLSPLEGLTARQTPRRESTEPLRIKTDQSGGSKPTRSGADAKETAESALENYVTPKAGRALRQANPPNEEIYIARFKHEEVLEETVSKMKQKHIQEIQRLREEFEVRLHKEISQELERELETFERQQRVFEERNTHQEKTDKAKNELIQRLESELNALKHDLAAHMEVQMRASRNLGSLASEVGAPTAKEEDFQSPRRTGLCGKFNNSSLMAPRDTEASGEDTREQIQQLNQRLREAIETIDQDQVLFEEFKVMKDGLELRLKILAKSLEAENKRFAAMRNEKEALEREKEGLEAKMLTIAEKTRAIIAKYKEKYAVAREKVLAEREEVRRLNTLLANVPRVPKPSKTEAECEKKPTKKPVKDR